MTEILNQVQFENVNKTDTDDCVEEYKLEYDASYSKDLTDQELNFEKDKQVQPNQKSKDFKNTIPT